MTYLKREGTRAIDPDFKRSYMRYVATMSYNDFKDELKAMRPLADMPSEEFRGYLKGIGIKTDEQLGHLWSCTRETAGMKKRDPSRITYREVEVLCDRADDMVSDIYASDGALDWQNPPECEKALYAFTGALVEKPEVIEPVFDELFTRWAVESVRELSHANKLVFAQSLRALLMSQGTATADDLARGYFVVKNNEKAMCGAYLDPMDNDLTYLLAKLVGNQEPLRTADLMNEILDEYTSPRK